MARIGFHASHEQFPPSELLSLVKSAEAAGVKCAMSSDHFKPWGPDQGHSGYAWSWLGAAMEATQLHFGVISAPGYRYHPAILAQGAATLAEMYPGRFWFALGSGQRLNEDMVGRPWPSKAERNARLRECTEILPTPPRVDTATHRRSVPVSHARLYSSPATRPLPFSPAVTETSAEFLAGWA